MTRSQAIDSASIVVPTLGRAGYVGTLLGDLVRLQSLPRQVEVVVVDDGHSAGLGRMVREFAPGRPFPLRYVEREGPQGVNAARNTGARCTGGELILFLDDDCRVPPGWLAALCHAAAATPEAEAFGGPIVLDLDGHPRWCGCEPFPVTALDRGPVDRWVDVVYGANLTVRRSALDRVGGFDEQVDFWGEEVEWQLRLRRAGGLVRYVAAAGVAHTRSAADLRLGVLLRAAAARGARSERLYGPGPAPHRARLAARVVRRLGHALRRRCWVGVVLAAEATGALWGAAGPRRGKAKGRCS